jgi:hypothetical protein
MNRVGLDGRFKLVAQPFEMMDAVLGFQIQVLALPGHNFLNFV